MARQDYWGEGQSEGVRRLSSQTLKKQHGKFIDEANETRGSTQMKWVDLNCKSWLATGIYN